MLDLASIVCRRYNLTETNLRSPGKCREASHARSVLALLVRSMDNLSLEELAQYLGRASSGLCRGIKILQKVHSGSESLAQEFQELQQEVSRVREGKVTNEAHSAGFQSNQVCCAPFCKNRCGEER